MRLPEPHNNIVAEYFSEFWIVRAIVFKEAPFVLDSIINKLATMVIPFITYLEDSRQMNGVLPGYNIIIKLALMLKRHFEFFYRHMKTKIIK